MNRRLLIIIAVVIVLLGLAAVGYYFFARSTPGLVVGNPFGSAGNRDPGSLAPVPDTGIPVEGAGEVIAPRLLKLADGPVAKGMIALYIPPVVPKGSATTTASSTSPVGTPADVEVRYIERASGNLYSFRVHDRSSVRISNKTLPGVQEAAWTADGSRAFLRFIEKDTTGDEHISTYMLPAAGEGGYFLEQNLTQVTVASSSVLSLLSSGSGSVAQISGASGTGGKTLFTSALSSLRVAFAGSRYLATTKASANLDGYAFQVDAGGSFTRLLGPLRGLTTLPSPSGTQVLYSYTDRTKLYMQVLDTTTRTSVPLPLVTLTEKCVWTKTGAMLYCAVPTTLGGTLPDEWYQGSRLFTDRIWRIDLSTRVASLVFDPMQLTDQGMDMESLTLDSTSDVLIFLNKRDGSLWSYDL